MPTIRVRKSERTEEEIREQEQNPNVYGTSKNGMDAYDAPLWKTVAANLVIIAIPLIVLGICVLILSLLRL